MIRYTVFFSSTELERWPWWLRWIARRLAPNRAHCGMYFLDPEGGSWVVINPVFGKLDVYGVDGSVPEQAMFERYGLEGGVVSVDAPREQGHGRFVVRGPLTCVVVVKAIIGVRWPLVITPWQLYRRLQLMKRRRNA